MFAIFFVISYNCNGNLFMILKNETKDKKKLNLHQGHRKRLRDRIVLTNCESPDHELLEYILQQPIKRRDTNEIAHRLLLQFGNFANVCDASIEELMQIDGVGKATAIFLTTIPKMFQIYKQSKEKSKPYIDNQRDLYNYIGHSIEHLPYEEFYVICLNSAQKVISRKKISRGDGQMVAFDIKQVADYCKNMNATSVALVHNHPTGSAIPSPEDIEATKQLYFNLAFSGISLVEHLVVNYLGEIFSFSKEGYISEFASKKTLLSRTKYES